MSDSDSDSDADLSDFEDSEDELPVPKSKSAAKPSATVSRSSTVSTADSDDDDDDDDSSDDDESFAEDDDDGDDDEDFRKDVLKKAGTTKSQQVEVDSDEEEEKAAREEEKRKRLGDKAYKAAKEQVDDVKMNNQLRKLAAERKNIEREQRIQAKKDEEADAERKKANDAINRDLDKHSTHLVKNAREIVRQRSGELLEMQQIAEKLELESNGLDAASTHIRKEFEDSVRQTSERKALTRQKSDEKLLKKLSEHGVSTGPLDHRAKAQARRDRMDRIREKKEREKEERESKAMDEEFEKRQAERELYRSEKARMERAYNWYTRLAFPKRDEMKDKIAAMPNPDICIDDVDLLPWNASGKIVNVPKLNSILLAK
jgi:hypothetical protein